MMVAWSRFYVDFCVCKLSLAQRLTLNCLSASRGSTADDSEQAGTRKTDQDPHSR